ncbi:MAG TPA: FAD:protein FMN transferase [Solirubrobacterales bacterium]|nr:FAD:protein FMN transferase [Solirubrobacterales bacterium]
MSLSASWPALGTTAVLVLSEAEMFEPARAILEEELAAIDLACSRFRPDSELSEVNRSASRVIEVSALFSEALAVALRAARLTDGDVDPTVGAAMRAIGYGRDFQLVGQPHAAAVRVRSVAGWRSVSFDPAARRLRVPRDVELDLGATAKALAADRAANRISRAVEAGVLVSLGGDVSVAGPPPQGGWRIQVRDDHRAGIDDDAPTVSISTGGLATSSTTARKWVAGGQNRHHIIDPQSGDSADVVWRTVSVAAGSCVDANIASTAAIVRGDRAPQWLRELGLPSRLVNRDGEVTRLAGWPQESAR